MRPPKKSDTIEVRLTHEAKRAFMRKCEADGQTASGAIRCYIDAAVAPERRRWRVRLVLGVLPVVAAAAYALMPARAVASHDPRPQFNAMDRNHDGVLTPDEYGDDRYAPVNCDGSRRPFVIPLGRSTDPGFLGMRTYAISRAALPVVRMDRDGDGKVTYAEFAAGRAEMFYAGFAAIDTSHDGTIDPREYAAAVRRLGFGGKGVQAAAFGDLDRNGDGKVDWDEFTA